MCNNLLSISGCCSIVCVRCAAYGFLCRIFLFPFASENEMEKRKRVITAVRKIYMRRLNEYQCSHNSFWPIVNRRSRTNGLNADGIAHAHASLRTPPEPSPSYLFRLGIYLFLHFISHKNLNCISFQAMASVRERNGNVPLRTPMRSLRLNHCAKL